MYRFFIHPVSMVLLLPCISDPNHVNSPSYQKLVDQLSVAKYDNATLRELVKLIKEDKMNVLLKVKQMEMTIAEQRKKARKAQRQARLAKQQYVAIKKMVRGKMFFK